MKEKITLKNTILSLSFALGCLLLGVILGFAFPDFFSNLRETNLSSSRFNVILPSGINTSSLQAAITPEEAVRQAASLPGFDGKITGQAHIEVRALPDKSGNIQYWSVKTDKGYVTVKAKP